MINALNDQRYLAFALAEVHRYLTDSISNYGFIAV